MRAVSGTDGKGGEGAVDRAACVAERLGIPHHVLDLRETFEERIITPFFEAYRAGKTPSPCVCCNRLIKFGALLDMALEIGCSYLATGHYARLETPHALTPLLFRGRDPAKDQSYFLFELTPGQLMHVRFPLGDWTKQAVQREAADQKLLPAGTRQSQDLCFVPDGDYAALLLRRFPDIAPPGDIVAVDGTKLGTHRGLIRYTVGQRQGLGLSGGPWYVVELRPETNKLVVGRRKDTLCQTVRLRGVNWLDETPFASSAVGSQVQLRYRMRPVEVTEAFLHDSSRSFAEIALAEPVAGVAPGQAAVFYRGDRVLGGGWIE